MNHNMQQQQHQQTPQNFPPHYPPYGQFPPYQGQRFGPQSGFPGEPGGPTDFTGYPPMPFGGPRGWYGAPGQHFPPPSGQLVSPPQMPLAPGGPNDQQIPIEKPAQSTPSVEATAQDNPILSMQAQGEPRPMSSQINNNGSIAAQGIQKSKVRPDESRALNGAAFTPSTATGESRSVANGQKNGQILPAVPVTNQPSRAGAGTSVSSGQPDKAPVGAALQYQNPTQAATAAVAAAMAKLPPVPGSKAPHGKGESTAIDNLTRKVNEMRTDDRVRNSRQPGTGGYAAGHRGGRGGRRGHRHDSNIKPIDVPATDFDFESSNAKFNKQDLVKEAIATGSPKGDSPITHSNSPNGTTGSVHGAGANSAGVGTATTNTTSSTPSKTDGDVVIPAAPATYNKAASFFDNISSELKDREEAGRVGGREFRTEERRKNMETFGQGSVDSGYRGGYHRGRGRGRGGFRGRGGGGGYGRGGRGGNAGRGRGYGTAGPGPVHVQQIRT